MKVAEAKRKLNSAAKKFGGHIEDDSVGNEVRLQVCAPEGKWWMAADGPHLVVTTFRGPQSWLDDVVEDALERIACGVQDAIEEEA